MKLRNKRAGDIADVKIDTYNENGKGDRICLSVRDDENLYRCIASYASIAELYEEWEDYTPRIEDDKVRKLVKQWLMISRVNNENIFFDELMNGFYLYEENSDRSAASISFPDNIKFNLEDSKDYTITELCGEEE